MKNIIICADSIEYMAKIPDNSVDLIFADPPYWMRVEGVLMAVMINGTAFLAILNIMNLVENGLVSVKEF